MTKEIRRLRNPQTGEIVEGVVIPVEHEENTPVRIRLADGALIRIEVDIAEVPCVPDVLDSEGIPLYFVKNSNMITILEGPRVHND